MIDLVNISVQFGGKYLYKNVSCKINAGDRISLVGANGTGKSSLLRVINGENLPESGNIFKQKRINLGYLPQENVTHHGSTLLDEAFSALSDITYLQSKEVELTELLDDPYNDEEILNDLVNQLGEVHQRLQELDSYAANSKVEKILIGLGFGEEDFLRLTEEFSGGWQMRIALAKILISQNDILLLDEPTNHLDIDSLDWLINFFQNYKGAIVLVSHDKHFVNRVTNKTLEIYGGKFYQYNGNFDAWLKFKAERDILMEEQYLAQQRKIKETENFIDRFRYKATKARQVQSRIKALDKVELIEAPASNEEIEFKFPEPPSSGRTVMELKNIKKQFGEKVIFSNFNLTIERGEKIAFVGPNGAGKTTLAKIIAGVSNISGGERVEGYNTSIAYYAQDVSEELDKEAEIIDMIYDLASDKSLGQVRSLLGSFLFTGDDVFKKIGVLSGGEKSRVALAKILLYKANLLILDEPTNHLDYSSKLMLQKALINFTGTLILVSHDIDFLNPIINKVFEIKPGFSRSFPGNIEYYLYKKSMEIGTTEISSQISQYDSAISISTNKKEAKRLEAEMRQKRSVATKDIAKQIKALEEEIDKLEKKEKKLEMELGEESVYKNAALAKEKTSEYATTKELLKTKLGIWETKNEEMAKIESKLLNNC